VKGIEVETEELLPIEELQIGKKLGTGGFGAVFQGRYRGQEVAIKKLHISDGQVTAAQVDEFKKEVACLQALRHARLVSFIGAALQPPHSLCIVTEFMPNGSLYDLLHQRKQRLERSQRASISVQCVEGVTFLHSRSPPFVHRDLKSLNVVMDFALNAKLCDFGLTQSMEKTHISRRDNEGGSPRYMAPELFDSKGKITEKVDVWATGALVLEVFTGRLPHEECNALQQVMTKTLIERKMPFLDWKDVPQDLKVLAERCFEFQPQRRIDAPSFLEGLRNLRP
jgi:serine/threonine protein kinase